MSTTEEFFYGAGKKSRITVERASQEPKGTTLDGDPIYHTVYVRNGKHVSYDTVYYRGEHHYIPGSGHERDDRTHQTVGRWDGPWTNVVTWKEALQMRTCQVINC